MGEVVISASSQTTLRVKEVRKKIDKNNDGEQRSDFLCPRGPPSHGRRIVGDLSPVVSPTMEDGRSSQSGCEGKRTGCPDMHSNRKSCACSSLVQGRTLHRPPR